jgi:hypothetical protein
MYFKHFKNYGIKQTSGPMKFIQKEIQQSGLSYLFPQFSQKIYADFEL